MQPPPKIMVEPYVNIIYADKGTAERSSITFDQAKGFQIQDEQRLHNSHASQWLNSGTFIGPTNHMCHDERSERPSAAPDGGMIWIRTPSRVFHSKKLHSNDKVPGSPDDRIPPHSLTKDQRVGEYGSAMMAKDMFRNSDAFKPFPADTPKYIQEIFNRIRRDKLLRGSLWPYLRRIRDVVLVTSFVTMNFDLALHM